MGCLCFLGFGLLVLFVGFIRTQATAREYQLSMMLLAMAVW